MSDSPPSILIDLVYSVKYVWDLIGESAEVIGEILPVRQSTTYMALYHISPTIQGDSGLELTGMAGYSRQPVTFSEPHDGSCYNVNDITFSPAENWGKIVAYGITDAPVNGEIRHFGRFDSPLELNKGDRVTFSNGEITISTIVDGDTFPYHIKSGGPGEEYLRSHWKKRSIHKYDPKLHRSQILASLGIRTQCMREGCTQFVEEPSLTLFCREHSSWHSNPILPGDGARRYG